MDSCLNPEKLRQLRPKILTRQFKTEKFMYFELNYLKPTSQVRQLKPKMHISKDLLTNKEIPPS